MHIMYHNDAHDYKSIYIYKLFLIVFILNKSNHIFKTFN